MDKFVSNIFKNEIRKQSEFAITSVQNMQSSLDQRNIKMFWYFAHNFLSNTANVSKLLFGTKEQITEKRKALRDELNVSNKSLIKIRKMRNNFEHFDERVENWLENTNDRHFIDSNIGPKNMIGGFEHSTFMRHYDPSTGTLTFQGDEYNIPPIVDELVELLRILESQEKI